MSEFLLQVHHLKKYFPVRRGLFQRVVGHVKAVDDVSFGIRPGETLDIEVELTERMSNAFFLTAKVSVGGQVTVRFEFACAATDAG